MHVVPPVQVSEGGDCMVKMVVDKKLGQVGGLYYSNGEKQKAP